jgi:hypothetical protein
MTTHVHREEIKNELEIVREKLKLALEALDTLSTLRPMRDAERYRIAMQAIMECNVINLARDTKRENEVRA